MQLGRVAVARADENVVERRRAWSGTALHVEKVAIAKSPAARVGGTQMKVPRGNDDTASKLDLAGRTDEGNATTGLDERSARGHRWIDAKDRGIGQRDLELCIAARGTDDSHGVEPPFRSLNGDGFHRGELAGLGQLTRYGQRRAPEEHAQVIGRQVYVPVRHADADVDGGRGGRPLSRYASRGFVRRTLGRCALPGRGGARDACQFGRGCAKPRRRLGASSGSNVVEILRRRRPYRWFGATRRWCRPYRRRQP